VAGCGGLPAASTGKLTSSRSDSDSGVIFGGSSARGFHHPPVAQAVRPRLLVPIDVSSWKLALPGPKLKAREALVEEKFADTVLAFTEHGLVEGVDQRIGRLGAHDEQAPVQQETGHARQATGTDLCLA
jgi:hypothetical protein